MAIYWDLQSSEKHHHKMLRRALLLFTGIAMGFTGAILIMPDYRKPIIFRFTESIYSGVCAQIVLPPGGKINHLDILMNDWGGLEVSNGYWSHGADWNNIHECGM